MNWDGWNFCFLGTFYIASLWENALRLRISKHYYGCGPAGLFLKLFLRSQLRLVGIWAAGQLEASVIGLFLS